MEDRCGLPFEVGMGEIAVDPLWEKRQDLNQAMTIVDATKYLKTNLPLYRMALAVAAEAAKNLVTALQQAEAEAMENPSGR